MFSYSKNDQSFLSGNSNPTIPGIFKFFFAGINTLINIMSRLGQDDPSPSR